MFRLYTVITAIVACLGSGVVYANSIVPLQPKPGSGRIQPAPVIRREAPVFAPRGNASITPIQRSRGPIDLMPKAGNQRGPVFDGRHPVKFIPNAINPQPVVKARPQTLGAKPALAKPFIPTIKMQQGAAVRNATKSNTTVPSTTNDTVVIIKNGSVTIDADGDADDVFIPASATQTTQNSNFFSALNPYNPWSPLAGYYPPWVYNPYGYGYGGMGGGGGIAPVIIPINNRVMAPQAPVQAAYAGGRNALTRAPRATGYLGETGETGYTGGASTDGRNWWWNNPWYTSKFDGTEAYLSAYGADFWQTTKFALPAGYWIMWLNGDPYCYFPDTGLCYQINTYGGEMTYKPCIAPIGGTLSDLPSNAMQITRDGKTLWAHGPNYFTRVSDEKGESEFQVLAPPSGSVVPALPGGRVSVVEANKGKYYEQQGAIFRPLNMNGLDVFEVTARASY